MNFANSQIDQSGVFDSGQVPTLVSCSFYLFYLLDDWGREWQLTHQLVVKSAVKTCGFDFR